LDTVIGDQLLSETAHFPSRSFLFLFFDLACSIPTPTTGFIVVDDTDERIRYGDNSLWSPISSRFLDSTNLRGVYNGTGHVLSTSPGAGSFEFFFNGNCPSVVFNALYPSTRAILPGTFVRVFGAYLNTSSFPEFELPPSSAFICSVDLTNLESPKENDSRPTGDGSHAVVEAFGLPPDAEHHLRCNVAYSSDIDRTAGPNLIFTHLTYSPRQEDRVTADEAMVIGSSDPRINFVSGWEELTILGR
jgi:hypothetical protein